jgi:hypothetical protein
MTTAITTVEFPEFKKAYNSQVGYSVEKEQAEKVLEVVEGWTVVAVLPIEKEDDPLRNLPELPGGPYQMGRYFTLDNRGTSWDPHGLNKGAYEDGNPGPDTNGVYLFPNTVVSGVELPGREKSYPFQYAYFENSNNYGYRWLFPSPWGKKLRNFSSIGWAHYVYVIPPEGVQIFDLCDQIVESVARCACGKIAQYSVTYATVHFGDPAPSPSLRKRSKIGEGEFCTECANREASAGWERLAHARRDALATFQERYGIKN